MALTPASFFASVAPFGARNHHLLRDLSTVSLALTLHAAQQPATGQASPTRQDAIKP